MTTNKTIRLNAGNSETVLLTFTNEDDGTPFDITGKRIDFLVKTTADAPDASPLALWSTQTSEIAITNGPGGLATLSLEPADMPAAGQYWYHCNSVAGTTVKTAGRGYLIVDQV